MGVQKTLAKSFETHPMRNLTKRAVMQRMDFCMEKAAELRKIGWGTERIVDSIGEALAAHLDHRDWEPSKRACWAPGDGD